MIFCITSFSLLSGFVILFPLETNKSLMPPNRLPVLHTQRLLHLFVLINIRQIPRVMPSAEPQRQNQVFVKIPHFLQSLFLVSVNPARIRMFPHYHTVMPFLLFSCSTFHFHSSAKVGSAKSHHNTYCQYHPYRIPEL